MAFERSCSLLSCGTFRLVMGQYNEYMSEMPPKPFHSEEPSAVNPSHYRSHPSGVECIAITEHLNFCLGNAIKYIWRAGLKGNDATRAEDLRKAAWYIERELRRLGAVD